VTNRQGFLEKHHFLVRRLHSLTGIVPIGVFLIAHLVTNSSLAWGKFGLRAEGAGMGIQDGGYKYFQKEVAWINNEVPHLLLIEITLWVSIAFHSLLGLYYARTGKSNTTRYAYQDNRRYTLQRWSGYIGILFIFYHVATLRWGWTFLVPGGTRWSHDFSASTLVAALQGSKEGWTAAGLVVSLGYFIGVSLLVFHFANGLWTAAITWGLTISESAQKRWGVVCFGLGVGLMAAAWSALGAALVASYPDARAVEERLIVDTYGEDRLQELLEKYPEPNTSPAPEVSAVPATDQD
jgi:succinate dehydrogenase / fumarate reductase cytochrome b subunit